MVGARVYVGRLPYGVRQRDLEQFFKGYGRIREIFLKRGYGFVELDDHRDANDAVYELNGKELLGERVLVEHAKESARRGNRTFGGSSQRRGSSQYGKYGPPTRTAYRLIVENLSSKVTWQGLKDYVRQAGKVTYAKAHKERRNEGVVEFATYSDMKNALHKLDDTDLNGQRIRLFEERRGRRFQPSSSSSRSRSRSHRRSRSRSRSRRDSRSRSRISSWSRSRRSSWSCSSRSIISESKSRSRSRSKSREKERSKSKTRSHQNLRNNPDLNPDLSLYQKESQSKDHALLVRGSPSLKVDCRKRMAIYEE